MRRQWGCKVWGLGCRWFLGKADVRRWLQRPSLQVEISNQHDFKLRSSMASGATVRLKRNRRMLFLCLRGCYCGTCDKRLAAVFR